VGGGYDIDKYIEQNTGASTPRAERTQTWPPGQKAATQSDMDMGADQGESSGRVNEVNAFD
jgi:hypothetical protein